MSHVEPASEDWTPKPPAKPELGPMPTIDPLDPLIMLVATVIGCAGVALTALVGGPVMIAGALAAVLLVAALVMSLAEERQKLKKFDRQVKAYRRKMKAAHAQYLQELEDWMRHSEPS